MKSQSVELLAPAAICGKLAEPLRVQGQNSPIPSTRFPPALGTLQNQPLAYLTKTHSLQHSPTGLRAKASFPLQVAER